MVARKDFSSYRLLFYGGLCKSHRIPKDEFWIIWKHQSGPLKSTFICLFSPNFFDSIVGKCLLKAVLKPNLLHSADFEQFRSVFLQDMISWSGSPGYSWSFRIYLHHFVFLKSNHSFFIELSLLYLKKSKNINFII